MVTTKALPTCLNNPIKKSRIWIRYAMSWKRGSVNTVEKPPFLRGRFGMERG